jgi:hypothetical protein
MRSPALGRRPRTCRLQGFQASLTAADILENPLGLVPMRARDAPGRLTLHVAPAPCPAPASVISASARSLPTNPQATAQMEGMEIPNGGVTFSSQHNAEVSDDAANLVGVVVGVGVVGDVGVVYKWLVSKAW